MTAQGIYINVSRRNDDLSEMIEQYSKSLNLSKADMVNDILRAYLKLIQCKDKIMDMVRWSLSKGVTLEEVEESMDKIKAAAEISTGQKES